MTKTYLGAVISVNLIFGINYFLAPSLFLQRILPEIETLTIIYGFTPFFLLLFNILSILFALSKLKPFDFYARVGFWISVLISLILLIPSLFVGIKPH